VRAEKYTNVKDHQNRQQSTQREYTELKQESERLKMQQVELENVPMYGE
jgi:hypothetical protein